MSLEPHLAKPIKCSVLFVWTIVEGYEKQLASPPGRVSMCVCVRLCLI